MLKGFAVLLSLFVTASAYALPKIGTVKEWEASTAICELHDAQDHLVFFEDLQRGPVMNFDGQETKLITVPGAKTLWDFHHLGEPVHAKYQTNGLTIDFRGRVDHECEPSEESCESTSFIVDGILTDGGEITVLKGLGGSCGV